jgi:hypothetical protein
MTQNSKNIKAQVTAVQIGNLEIEGYLLDDGSFGVSLSDFGRLIGVEPKQVRSRILNSKLAQSLTSKGFQGSRKCSVPKAKGSSVQVIPIDWVVPLLQVAARMGIGSAWDILDALAGLSLQQLFCDAFCIKFEQSDRQEWLKQRLVVKRSFKNSLTDALQRYGYIEPWQYGKFVHAMQEALGIKDGSRDELSVEELVLLESAQRYIGMAVDEFNLNPYDALKRYVAIM